MAKPRVLPVADAHLGKGVGRRNVLRGLLTGAGAGLAVPGLAATHPLAAHAHQSGRMVDARAKALHDGEPECLDAYQMKMLESLAERIVPGATKAGCPRFIDRLLAVGAREDARKFMTALGAVDARSRNRFGRPWPDLDETQQVELLSTASTDAAGTADPGSWAPGTPVAEYLAAAKPDPTPRVTLRDHFDLLKGWVVGAYYSSETGLHDLGYTGPYFAESFPGCTHEGGHRES